MAGGNDARAELEDRARDGFPLLALKEGSCCRRIIRESAAVSSANWGDEVLREDDLLALKEGSCCRRIIIRESAAVSSANWGDDVLREDDPLALKEGSCCRHIIRESAAVSSANWGDEVLREDDPLALKETDAERDDDPRLAEVDDDDLPRIRADPPCKLANICFVFALIVSFQIRKRRGCIQTNCTRKIFWNCCFIIIC